MEQILGVTYDASKHKTHEHWVESRINTVEADALDQAEGDNKARTRYQRMFWEPVVEGQVREPPASTCTCCQSFHFIRVLSFSLSLPLF
jgi:hypothetical protein